MKIKYSRQSKEIKIKIKKILFGLIFQKTLHCYQAITKYLKYKIIKWIELILTQIDTIWGQY